MNNSFWYLSIICCLLITNNLLSQNQPGEKSFLALGDSYTIGESVPQAESWPWLLKDSLQQRGVSISDPLIIAKTGWRTDQLKKAINEKNPPKNYDLVGLLIGVNNQYQGKPASEYVNEFENLLKIAIDQAGGDKDKVFVISIPDYGYTPFGESKQKKISHELDEYNQINQSITTKAGVDYYYITDISRSGLENPELVANDKLHPSGYQYALWVELILKDKEFIKKLSNH